MLSYRHAFHAGSPADVLKHAVLAFILRYATRKVKPLYVLDTHAGAGGYDLGSPMAAKTREAEAGIARLRDAPEPWPALLAPYLRLVRRADGYPGSPLIATALLRPQDRLELVELHTTDHAALAERFRGAPHVRGVREDGLKVMVARMPPPERRATRAGRPRGRAQGQGRPHAAARTARRRPGRPELRGEDGVRDGRRGPRPRPPPLPDRHLPALVPGHRAAAC